MGGASSEVSATTTDVLVESAHFDPVTVARSARRHKLSTEASRRFERGVDTDVAAAAAELAVRLLVEHGGGEPGPITDVDLRTPREPLRMSADLPDRLVGRSYGRDRVVELLTAVGCRVEQDGEVLVVTPPSWRPDLTLGVDLVEEVARLDGYAEIPSVLPAAPAGRGLTTSQKGRRSIARALAEHGLVEVLTYPFVGADVGDVYGLPADDPRRPAVRLANPLSEEQPYLRTWILPTLVEAARRNLGRGQSDLALFEIGLVVRPRPGADAVAPRPAVDHRPAPEELAALDAALPRQPRRVGILLAGHREQPGWYGAGRPGGLDGRGGRRAARRSHPRPDADRQPGRRTRRGTRAGAPGWSSRACSWGTPASCTRRWSSGSASRRGPARRRSSSTCCSRRPAASATAAPVSTFPVAKEDVALVVDADGARGHRRGRAARGRGRPAGVGAALRRLHRAAGGGGPQVPRLRAAAAGAGPDADRGGIGRRPGRCRPCGRRARGCRSARSVT